jgi:hypothetical protein
VLNVPVSEIILNEPRVRSLIGKSEAASVPKHVLFEFPGAGLLGAARFALLPVAALEV